MFVVDTTELLNEVEIISRNVIFQRLCNRAIQPKTAPATSNISNNPQPISAASLRRDQKSVARSNFDEIQFRRIYLDRNYEAIVAKYEEEKSSMSMDELHDLLTTFQTSHAFADALSVISYTFFWRLIQRTPTIRSEYLGNIIIALNRINNAPISFMYQIVVFLDDDMPQNIVAMFVNCELLRGNRQFQNFMRWQNDGVDDEVGRFCRHSR